jgi:hypothetical protein
MPIAQKNEIRGANASMERPAFNPARTYFQPVRQGIRQFEIGGRASLLHMVAGNADTVELRHVLRRVGENIGDDAHRRFRRINVRVAHHVLFENIVLDRAGQLGMTAPFIVIDTDI